jgi:hypothetical protein
MKNTKLVVRPNEAADYLNMTVGMIYKKVKNGDLVAISTSPVLITLESVQQCVLNKFPKAEELLRRPAANDNEGMQLEFDFGEVDHGSE